MTGHSAVYVHARNVVRIVGSEKHGLSGVLGLADPLVANELPRETFIITITPPLDAA